MNIRKFVTLIAVGAVALVVGMPTNASAVVITASTKAKIKVLNTKLKKLPNAGASYSSVKSLVTKLSKLDPKKANKYYSTGLKKLVKSPSQQKDAKNLSKEVVKIVKKSDLTASQIAKITKSVEKAEDKVQPYQAYVSVSHEYALS